MAAPHVFPGSDAIALAKARLRTEAREHVRRVSAPLPETFTSPLAAIVSRVGATSLAAFWPMRGEPDLRPFLAAFDRDGGTVLLPRVLHPDHPLSFDRWRPERGVRPGTLGTGVADAPPGECDLAPDLILVPLLAFDRACRRLGRGRGFYDRTLHRHAGIPAIGVAFAIAERSEIPCAPHDRTLDAVVTEHDTIFAPASRIAPR